MVTAPYQPRGKLNHWIGLSGMEVHWYCPTTSWKKEKQFDVYLLVGGLEDVLFFHILGIVTPTDELIFFRGVAQPPTSNVL